MGVMQSEGLNGPLCWAASLYWRAKACALKLRGYSFNVRARLVLNICGFITVRDARPLPPPLLRDGLSPITRPSTHHRSAHGCQPRCRTAARSHRTAGGAPTSQCPRAVGCGRTCSQERTCHKQAQTRRGQSNKRFYGYSPESVRVGLVRVLDP